MFDGSGTFTLGPITVTGLGWLPLFALLVALLLALVLGLPLLSSLLLDKAKRRLDPKELTETEFAQAIAVWDSEPPALTRYLDDLYQSLRLPLGARDDVVREIEDHLVDTIEGLQAEGLEQEAAVREAIARLGSAQELARNLQRAHQTRRLLLAGAAGGIAAVPGGFLIGILTLIPFSWGWFLGALAILTVLGLATDVNQQFLMSIVGFGGVNLLVFILARRTSLVFAGLSNHTETDGGLLWAWMATPVVVLICLLAPFHQMTWVLALTLMLTPASFVAGSRIWIDRPIPLTFRRGFVLVGLLTVITALALAPLLPEHRSSSSAALAAAEQRIGPVPPASLVTPNPNHPQPNLLDLYCIPQNHRQTCKIKATPRQVSDLASWSDFRIDVWRGAPSVFEPGGVDLNAVNSTLAVDFKPTWGSPDNGLAEARANVDIGMRRDGPDWWLVLTAQAPDGTRYRLTDGCGVRVDFDGSLWDWLTAPG